jgi:hypothetical protein
VPEVPDDAVQAAAEVLRGMIDRDALLPVDVHRSLARTILEAAAPAMAEHAARAIEAHMDSHGPRSDRNRRGYRRHFRTAVQVVSLAFSTREDKLQAAAKALTESNYAACREREDDGS